MDSEKTNSLILLRGLPGSGKSTLAELLSENGKYSVYSVDQYFIDENGNYKFNHLVNYLAYDACLLNVKNAMENKVEKIFVDNTFTIDWEMEPYIKLAGQSGYKLFVVTVENYHGRPNVHGITDEQIRKMAEKYKVKLFP